MQNWAQEFTTPGGRRTFVAEESNIPEAAKNAVYWEKCPSDGRWYFNSGAFEGKTKICAEINAAPKPQDPVQDAFVMIYDPEPGPNALKWRWREARRTFVDDRLPDGMSRADVTRITDLVKPYGLPGARCFRLKRFELPVGAPPALDDIYSRVLFYHRATQNAVIAYLDYPVAAVADDNRILHTVRSWQEAVAWSDPGSFPKWAVIAPGHNEEVRGILAAAQAS